MKRLITLITLVLLTGILLPSCGVTIQKRQHNKGFYVNTNPRIPAAKDTKREIRPEEQEAVATANLPEEQTEARAESEAILAETVVSGSTSETAVATPEEAPEALTDNVSTPYNVPVAAQQTDKTSFIEKMAERNPLTKKLNTQKMKSARGSSSEGLSLFWIVILILLVLWALGVIGGGWGLGGLIYVLLVIALILLILWLLRIV